MLSTFSSGQTFHLYWACVHDTFQIQISRKQQKQRKNGEKVFWSELSERMKKITWTEGGGDTVKGKMWRNRQKITTGRKNFAQQRNDNWRKEFSPNKK